MKARERRKTATLRLISAALKDRDIAARTKGVQDGIDETQILGMLQTMVKQREESIDHYEQGGRLELAEQEREEIAIITDFLPPRLDEAAMDWRDRIKAELKEAMKARERRKTATLRSSRVFG